MGSPDRDVMLGMTAALDAARQGLEHGELPIGAATVRDGRVLSARHTEEVRQGRRLVHADLLALDDADRLRPTVSERASTTLVVTLEPCLLCMGAASVFGAGHVHFGLESPSDGGARAAADWARQAGALDGFAAPAVSSGHERSECLALLCEFVAARSSGGLWRWARATLDAIDAKPGV